MPEMPPPPDFFTRNEAPEKNRWVSRDSGIFALEELRRLQEEHSKNPKSDSPTLEDIQLTGPIAPEASLTSAGESPVTQQTLRAALEHAISAWEERLDGLYRFVSLRQVFEKGFIVSLIVLASVASSAHLLAGAYDTLFKASIAGSTLLSVASAIMYVLDPYRQTKFYAARVRKAISIYQSFRQVLVWTEVGPSEQTKMVQRILSLSLIAREILEPHRDRW